MSVGQVIKILSQSGTLPTLALFATLAHFAHSMRYLRYLGGYKYERIYTLQKGSVKMNELYHHGVKGQKWGVRRYQNPDGSLTAAGKRRFKRVVSDEKKTAASHKKS